MKRTALRKRGRKYTQNVYERFGPKANMIRVSPCLVCGRKPSDPHHEPPVSRGAKAEALTPLCRRHHNVRHQLGPTRFTERYDIDLLAEAQRIEREWTEVA